MTDIGLNVLKPDRVIMRIFKRLDLVSSEDDFLGAIEVGRKFSEAVKEPIRYIDIIFVYYGQLDSPIFEYICSERNPRCDRCGVNEYCSYKNQIKQSTGWK